MIYYAAVVASAVLMWAAFPPLDFGWLAFVAPVPFLWAIRRVERVGDVILMGFLWGFAFYGGMLYWIFTLGAVAWFPLTLVLAAYATVYAVVVWLVRLWPAWRWWLIATGAWVAVEFLRARFPFGGFPWGSIGYAAGGTPGAVGAVQWVGPSGWSVVAIAFAAGLALLIENRKQWRFAVDTGVVIMLLVLAGSLFPPRADGEVLRVAIVQGGSPCPQTHCQNENQRIFESHLELTQTIPAGSVDLVVWAENSTGPPYEPEGSDAVRNAIIEEADRIGAFFLVSGTRREGSTQFRNVNVLLSPDGVKVGEYTKSHPVPFGEYVPLRSLLGFIPQLERVPRDMIRGGDPVVFPLDDGTLGSVISFEGAFIRSIRSVVDAGAEVLVVATNESTYGVTAASDQLIGMTRVNAAAVGQDLVHAAITGRSTFISADGAVGEKTDLLEETVLYGRVQYRNAGSTFYSRFGDLLLYAALLGMVVAVVWPGESRSIDAKPHSRAGSA